MNNVICIAGMHRSGTSLVASWLEGCGIKLYEKVGPNVGNKLGHFEDREILTLHVNSISKLGTRTKGWLLNKYDHPTFNKSEINLAKQIVASRADKSWGWKEPRTTLFLENWKQIIPNLKVLLLWRSCDKVVDSLLRRSRSAGDAKVMVIKKEQALMNWKLYNEAVINYVTQHPDETILVNIDNLLSMDEKVFNILKLKLDMEISYVPLANYYQRNMINESKRLDFKINEIRRMVSGINKIENQLVKHSVRFGD
jgi:hypothetical protein